MTRIFTLAISILLVSFSAAAQNTAAEKEHSVGDRIEKSQNRAAKNMAFDLSTNVFDWADFGTINVDFAMSVSRHITLQAGLKYNPWKFEPKKGPISLVQNQQKSASFGVRYWPWYVFSGWWICAKAQYCDYCEAGVWRQALDQGKALGAGLSAGYTVMINKRFNIEFGAGFWGGGLLEHTLYNAPGEEVPRESGPKGFIAINDVNISLHWLF